MPSLIVYTNPLTPGICQMPVYTVGDDQNWSLQFNNGINFYNPTGVSMNIGFVRGLGNLTYSSAFGWVDRMNNQHTGSFSIAAGVPSALTWDEDPIGVAAGNGAYLIRGRVPPSGTIRKVYVKYGGTGISTAPAVRFNAGCVETGQRAAATATVSAGDVSAIAVNDGGRGYSATNPPEVIITGDGTGAVWRVTTITAGSIVTLTKVGTGSGYTTATVTFRDAEASATATVGGTSTVTSVRLVNPGSGYTTAPAIGFSGGGGASAAATAALANSTWGLSGLTLTGAGTGFTSTPTVAFSGGTGTGAAGQVILSATSQTLTAINITESGSYSNQGQTGIGLHVTVTIAGGGGSGAEAVAILGEYPDGTGHGFVSQVIVTNGGSGYSSTPTIAFAPGQNTNPIVTATGTASVSAGIVGSIVLTNPGSGYGATAPTVTFTGGGGSGATATAQLIGSPLSPVITMTNNGSGYTSPPLVAFSGGAGSGATAVAVVALGITAITMTQGGYAYTSLPALSLVPNNGAVLIPAGIESHSVPFLQNFVPATAEGAITATPYTNGRRDSSGNLIYDDSLLIIRPRYLVQPTLTLQGDALTWAGVFNPATVMVQAVLNYRRSFVADVEIFGGGRLLFAGSLTIAAA